MIMRVIKNRGFNLVGEFFVAVALAFVPMWGPFLMELFR